MLSPIRSARRTLAVAAMVVGTLLAISGSVAAVDSQAAQTNGDPFILVVQVNGYLDPPNAEMIERSITDAERDGASLIALQIDSPASVGINEDELATLAGNLATSEVPVVVWIGPSGADVAGGALALQGDYRAMAQGSSAEGLSPTEALAEKLIDGIEPTLGEFIVSLDGKRVGSGSARVKLSTAKVIETKDGPRRTINQPLHFASLTVSEQARHWLARPSTALVLFTLGLGLIIFEFFTVSIGLAGATGAACVVGALVGFTALPTRPWAVGLLIVAFLGASIDAQVGGGPRLWTVIATVSLIAGSLFLYSGSSVLDPPWWVLGCVWAGAALMMIGGVPIAIRARFSTPTIGRESMIGEVGLAQEDVNPEGVVKIRGALWQARTNRATPIRAGEEIEVVSVQGVSLEVGPLGAVAKDSAH